MADEVSVKFGADIADIQAKLNTLNSEFNKATGGMANGAKEAATSTESSFAKMETAINGVKAAIAPLMAVFAPMLAAISAAKIINTASEFEQLEIRLNSVMGSAAKGKEAFAWIKQFAVDTPYSVQQTTDAFMTLKNFGLDPMDGTLQKVSDASAKYGKSAETAQRVTLALGQAWARGKLQGQDTLQMIDAGIPVYDLLSKATGKTAAEIQNMSEKGTMGRDVMRKLIDQMGVEGAGAAAAKMQSYAGAVSNMGDAFGNAIDKLRKQGGFDFLTQGILKFTEAIPAMVDVFGSAFAAMGDVVKALFSVVSDVFTGIGDVIHSVMGSGGSGLTAMEFFLNMIKVVQVAIIGFRIGFSVAFEGIKLALVSFAGYIDAAASASKEFFAGNFMKVGSAWDEGLARRKMAVNQAMQDIIAIAAKGKADIDAAIMPTATDGKVKDHAVDTSKDLDGQKKDGKSPKSQMAIMEAELSQQQIAMIEKHGREMDKAEEEAFWAAKLASGKVNSTDLLNVQKKATADKLAIAKAGLKEEQAATMQAAADYKAFLDQDRAVTEKATLDVIDVKRAELTQLRALGQIDALEELTALRKLESEKAKIIRDASTVRRDDYGNNTIEYRKAQDGITAQARQDAVTIKGIDDKVMQEKRKAWDDSVKPVFDAMDKSVNAVIARTTTIQKAFVDLANNIVLEITNKIIKQGINKMMDAMFASSGGGAGGGGIAGMLSGFMGSMAGSMAGGGVASAGGNFGGGLGAATANASANIPAGYNFGSMASFAVGAWNLPSDMVAQVHKGETILPASQAEKFRAGALGGTSTNMQVSNNFVLSGPVDRSTQDQIALMASSSMQSAMRRNG